MRKFFCAICKLRQGIMGGSKSQMVQQFFNINAVNETITNQVTKNRTTVSASQTNIQKLSIIIAGSVVGCDIKMNQKIAANNVSTVESAVQTVVDMKSDIQNTMEQSAEANMAMLTELGSLSDLIGESNQDIRQEINTTIRNVVETNITEENITELMAEQVNIQKSELIIGGNFDCRGGRGTIDASQDVVAQLTATAVGNMLTEKLMENSMVNAVTQSAAASVSQESSGFATIVDSVGGAVSGIISSSTGIFWIIGCVICVALIGIVMFMMSPAGQNIGKSAAGRI